jgi:hypothetical protein
LVPRHKIEGSGHRVYFSRYKLGLGMQRADCWMYPVTFGKRGVTFGRHAVDYSRRGWTVTCARHTLAGAAGTEWTAAGAEEPKASTG